MAKEAGVTPLTVLPHFQPYFRVAVRDLIQGLLDLFCRKSYVREHRPERRKLGAATYRIQWA